MAESIKIPPHSKEAEESVLGAILLDKDAIISVADFLHSEHFYSEINGDIYKSILKLYEERRKYKCAQCGKLWKQKDIDLKGFQEWNKVEREKGDYS